MIFSSWSFLIGFLPIVLLFYYLLGRKINSGWAKYFIVLASLYFYWYGSKNFFIVFLGSVIFNYIFGYILGEIKHNEGTNLKSKVLLTIGILSNVYLLSYYKYYDFYLENINLFFGKEIPLTNRILPIGISFFTFQLIAYLVDSYRGDTRGYKIIDYLLFITFFPQLIVGPIVHHKDVVSQYEDKKTYKLNIKNINIGLFLFFMGACKKLLIADALTSTASNGFANYESLSFFGSWIASISYTVSYYFDLSGYADMAIGLGMMFNIKIPENFNSPYKARNFADYWRRWHISLSKFLGDYIFRSFKKSGGSVQNFYFSIFMTFLVSGIWHGAGWTFLAWGIINGIFVIFSHMMTNNKKKMPFLLAWSITFVGIIMTRVLFVSQTFTQAFTVIKKMIGLDGFSIAEKSYYGMPELTVICIGLIIAFFFPNSQEIRKMFKTNIKFVIVTVVFIILTVGNLDIVGNFLYFQF